MALSQIKAIGIGKVIASLLGSIVVGVSTFIKVPQILKLATKTRDNRVSVANGLSLEGISLDTLNSLVHVIFNYQNKVPFVNYGESLFSGIQNAIIIVLAKYYRLYSSKEIGDESCKTQEEQLAVAMNSSAKTLGIMAGIIIVLSKLVPGTIISYLEVVNIPISILAKLPQIQQNYKLKTAKHLSDIMLQANVVGALIRVYTSSVTYASNARRKKNTTNDKILCTGYAASLMMHSILLGQSIVYDKLQRTDIASIEDAKEDAETEQETVKDKKEE